MVVSGEHAAVNGRPRSQRARSTYREVADELRDRITSGRLSPGQRMPTQAQLAGEFGVERSAVRQALRILQSENLLVDASKGSPAMVALHPRPALLGPEAPPQPTMVTLAPRIAEAFERSDVEIDALCMTAVSLTLAMGEPLRLIHEGRLKPARVHVRVLLPSRDIDLAFPAPAPPAAEPPVSRAAEASRAEVAMGGRLRRDWLAQRNAQGQVLRHNLLALRATHNMDVTVEFRALPFTPPVKLYLLNSNEALFAYYTLARRGEQIDHERVDVYDAQGVRQMLFAFEHGAGLRDTTFVEQSHLWFNGLWNTISQDLTLSS
ncbi:winged helix-turn-helix domain-containing protein [Streptomyces endophyticus]|uniref:Winged helix-turn-helix domain-containing protein n=1 Tax=Streptomyces endophyticus TaxID=714166 RepID=A0ABU6F931_9ACTN|nr:winged helix-turn-helix domain-containing protein [Streptomyces endophyticus]MEB8340540.1 winged helix-turn-helix domain-containing protein [Streptomyces endophyticus]